MAGKVTNEQASKANITIDDFRKAVNTVNPKNKGYVRFVPDGKGGVTIAKVNNKVDFCISWRTNIDAAHNRTMREKFALALTSDLRWADSTKVQKLADSITNARKKDGGKNADALSRKEIEAAFKKYDQMMNTGAGRMHMLENLMKATAQRCNLPATEQGVKALKEKYLKIPEGMDAQFSQLWYEGENGLMDELTFKAKLHEIENLCDDAVKRARVDTLMKDKAELYTGDKALDNTFGLHLSQDETADIRGALLHFLSIKGLAPQQGEGGIAGTGGMIFEKFMTDVLPALFKQNVENMREWAKGDNGNKELQMEANFSFEAIMEEAEKFMRGARQFIDNPPEYVVKSTGDAKFDKILEAGKGTVAGAHNMAVTGLMQKDALHLIENANISDAEGKRIFNDLSGAKKAYEAEGLLSTYTKVFLGERGIGPGVAKEEQLNDAFKSTLDAIDKDVYKLNIGIKIQNGTVVKNPETGKKELQDEGMGGYVQSMENAITRIAASGNGLDMGLVSKLMTFTMANLANRKVEMVANGIGVDLHLDKDSAEADKALMKSTAEAYFSFEKGVGKAIAKAKSSFEKLAKAQLKKGLVDDVTFNDMMLRAQAKFAQAHKAALQGFFQKSPIADAEDGRQLLDRIFKGKMQEAISELNNELAVNTIGNAIGVREKGTLMKVEERVTEALAQVGLDKIKVGVDGVVSEQEARGRLASGELRRLYSMTLASMLKKLPKVNGHVTVTEGFVEKVQSEFNSKVMSLMKNVSKLEAGYMKECEERLNDTLLNNIEGGHSLFKGYAEGEFPITESEKKTLVKEMTAEVMRFKASRLKAHVQELLDAPGSFDKQAAQDLARMTLEEQGVEKTGMAIFRVAEDRKKMVADFLADKESMQKIEQAILEGKVFGKGGPLENTYKGAYSEASILASKAMGGVIDRVKKMPLVYASGDKEALLKRIVEEAEKAAQGFARKWAKFRADFLKQSAAIEDDYSSLGAKNLEMARQWAFTELASRKDFDKLDIKMALGYYRNMLQEHLDGKIDKAKTSFDAYAAKVTAVYAKAMECFDGTLNLAKDMIVFSATKEAQQYLADVIIPKMKQRMEYLIYQNPDNFTEDKLEARDNELMKSFTDVAQAVFGTNDLARKQGLMALIKDAGADVLLQDKVEADAAILDLNRWVSSPEGHKMRVEAEKAMLDHIADYGDTFDAGNPGDFAPVAPGNALAEFRFAARDILKGHTAQLLYSVFDNEKVGEVREAFTAWLDAHGLSKFEDYRKTSAHERIMAKFADRVKLLQDNALNGGENEPILTPAFIQLIDQIIDSDGVSMLMAETNSKFLAMIMDRFAEIGDAHKFNPGDSRFSSLPSNVQAAVKQNFEYLRGAVSLKISEVLSEYDSLGGLDSIKEGVKKLDDETVSKKIIQDVLLSIDDCVLRFDLEAQSVSMVRNYTHTMERQVIKSIMGEEKAAKFPNGFIDLLASPLVPEKSRDTLRRQLSRISDGFGSAIGDALDRCRKNNATDTALYNTFQTTTWRFLDEVAADKEWKKQGLPILKALGKAV